MNLRLSRTLALTLFGLLVLGFGAVVAAPALRAQTPTPAAQPATPAQPAAKQAVIDAVERTLAVQSLRFEVGGIATLGERTDATAPAGPGTPPPGAPRIGTATPGAPAGETFYAEVPFSAVGYWRSPNELHATNVRIEMPVPINTELIIIGNEVWARNPATGEWVTLSQRAQRMPLFGAIQIAQVGPFLQGAIANAQLVGTEMVDGVQTRHYGVEFDRDFLTRAIERERPGLADDIRSVGGTADVWVGDDGLIRQMTLDLLAMTTPRRYHPDQSPGAAATRREVPLHVRATVRFAEFNAPVTITPPPAAAAPTEERPAETGQ